MAEEIIWDGESGKQYKFWIFPINHTFGANEVGNYIFAKREGSRWPAIYIGEGELQIRVAAAIREGCVTRKSATHIHANLINSERARKEVESDILAAHTEAYAPTGCNVRPGG